MIKPQRLGRFLEKDERGYLVPDVNHDRIDDKWKPLITISGQILFDFGAATSVYVRGSVPRGLAIENFSDLDLIYVAKHASQEAEAMISNRAAQEFPFVRKLEFLHLRPEMLKKISSPRKRPYFQMLLKTQSLFLRGEDVTQTIDPFRPGLEMVSYVFGLAREFSEYHDSGVVGRQWLSRRIIRSAFEITMNREKRFTRDLYLCYEQFSKFYPAYREKFIFFLSIA